jgi:hypothetical protein
MAPDTGHRYLTTPSGKLAATVYNDSFNWFVWAPNGDGHQNGVGDDIEDAKWQAYHAAKVYWYENGWESPFGTEIRQGSRVAVGGQPSIVGEVYADGLALVLVLPEADEFPKWKYAPVGLYPVTDLTPLPPTDYPEPEPEEEDDENSFSPSPP